MEDGKKVVRRGNLRFKECEVKLAVTMIEQLSTAMEIMYYLMGHSSEKSFVLMLISAEEIDLHALIQKEKRDTDILFCIDKSIGLHAVICQETKVDGGYKFAERIIGNIQSNEGKSAYCVELEVRSTHYSIKDVIFRALEAYILAKDENKRNEIIFKAIP